MQLARDAGRPRLSYPRANLAHAGGEWAIPLDGYGGPAHGNVLQEADQQYTGSLRQSGSPSKKMDGTL